MAGLSERVASFTQTQRRFLFLLAFYHNKSRAIDETPTTRATYKFWRQNVEGFAELVDEVMIQEQDNYTEAALWYIRGCTPIILEQWVEQATADIDPEAGVGDKKLKFAIQQKLVDLAAISAAKSEAPPGDWRALVLIKDGEKPQLPEAQRQLPAGKSEAVEGEFRDIDKPECSEDNQ